MIIYTGLLAPSPSHTDDISLLSAVDAMRASKARAQAIEAYALQGEAGISEHEGNLISGLLTALVLSAALWGLLYLLCELGVAAYRWGVA